MKRKKSASGFSVILVAIVVISSCAGFLACVGGIDECASRLDDMFGGTRYGAFDGKLLY